MVEQQCLEIRGHNGARVLAEETIYEHLPFIKGCRGAYILKRRAI
jgi:hypothetical protein